MPCSNRARASRQFSSSALQRQRPPLRNRTRVEEEAAEEEVPRPRMPHPPLPRRTRHLRRTQHRLLTSRHQRPALRPPPMPRPHRMSRRPARRQPRTLHRTLPRRARRPRPRRAQRKRLVLRRSVSRVLPAVQLRPWRATRRRRGPLPRSSRKRAPALPAAVPVRKWPNRVSGKICRGNPLRAAPAQLRRPRALPATPLHNKLPHNKTRLHNKTWRRNSAGFSRTRRRAPLHSKAELHNKA